MTLVDTGRFTYEEFRTRLIARISDDEARPYYESWLAALEDMLDGTIDDASIVERAAALHEADDHH